MIFKHIYIYMTIIYIYNGHEDDALKQLDFLYHVHF